MSTKNYTKQMRSLIKKTLFKLIELELFLHKKNNSNQKKLLLIRIDAIGDFVIFSPMLKYYRKIYPDYEITLLINEINEGLAESFIENFDKMALIDKEKFNKNLFYRRRLMIKLKKEGFNTAIYPTYSRERLGDYIVKISHAKEKIGSDGDLCNISEKQKYQDNNDYTKLIKATSEIINEPQRNREFIESLGKIEANDYIPTLMPTKKSKIETDILLKKIGLKNKKFVVVFPGASWPGKLWSIEKYSELINWLKAKYDLEIVICGSGDADEQLYTKLQKLVEFPIINIVGKTTLPILTTVLQQSSLYVGTDTGAVHISSAVGTPTICIMGGGHFGRFFPYGDLNKNKIVYDHNMKCKNDNWKCAKGLPKGQPAPCIANIQLHDVRQEIENIFKKYAKK